MIARGGHNRGAYAHGNRAPSCPRSCARNGLTGRSEVSEVIGALSRAEGGWTFDARDRMPRQSRATAHHLGENAPTATRTPSRERVRSPTQRSHSLALVKIIQK